MIRGCDTQPEVEGGVEGGGRGEEGVVVRNFEIRVGLASGISRYLWSITVIRSETRIYNMYVCISYCVNFVLTYPSFSSLSPRTQKLIKSSKSQRGKRGKGGGGGRSLKRVALFEFN